MIKFSPRYAVIAACLVGFAGCKLESTTTVTNIDTVANTAVEVPITLTNNGDKTNITHIAVSTTAPTLVSKVSSNCPNKLPAKASCQVTLSFISAQPVQGQFDVVVNYHNTKGKQVVKPNLTVTYTVTQPEPEQQTFMRYGNYSFGYPLGTIAVGSFFEEVFDSSGTQVARQIDPLSGNVLRPVDIKCANSRNMDADGNCVVYDNDLQKIVKINPIGEVLFEYEGIVGSESLIEVFADGSAVVIESNIIIDPFITNTTYHFYDSTGKLMFSKTGPRYTSPSVLYSTVDYGALIFGHAKQVIDGTGKVYYNITGYKSFVTYDALGNEVCSGTPVFETLSEWITPVVTPSLGSDNPTSNIYYVLSQLDESLSLTSRTMLTFDMRTCQQTNSLTHAGVFGNNSLLFVEHNDKIMGLPTTSYYDATEQAVKQEDPAQAIAMIGPVLVNGVESADLYVNISLLIPLKKAGYYYFTLSISSQVDFNDSDVISMLGQSLSANGLSGKEFWGIAKLNANGQLEVSKAINSAN